MPLRDLTARRNLLHRDSAPETILTQALADTAIGEVAVVSSFGAESVVLLHMISRVAPNTPVIFLDTEMLFPETLTYQREVAEQLGLQDIRLVTPDRETLMTRDMDGLLHRSNPDACCAIRKTEPLEKTLEGFGGWITGRKRIQNGARASMPLFEKVGRKVRINPLATWGYNEIRVYFDTHALPPHPLVSQGYSSIGCLPCTTKTKPGEDPRAGRWRGKEKTECGIHFVDGKLQHGTKGEAA